VDSLPKNWSPVNHIKRVKQLRNENDRILKHSEAYTSASEPNVVYLVI